MTEFYVGLQPWGTPEQVYDKIVSVADLVGADGYVGVFRYGGMTRADGEANMRLWGYPLKGPWHAMRPRDQALRGESGPGYLGKAPRVDTPECDFSPAR